MPAFRAVLISCIIWFLPSGALGQLFEQAFPDDATGVVLNAASADLGDVDGDGDLDLFVATLFGGTNHIFLNNGQGSFVKAPPSAVDARGFNAPAGRFLDVDGDGDQDLFVAALDDALYLFENAGGGTWVDRESWIPRVEDVRQLSVIDLEQDGDLDLFASVRSGMDNVLLVNDGSGRYTATSLPPATRDGGDSTCVEWMDADDDGDLDLFVCDANGDNRLYETVDGQTMERRHIEGLTDIGGRTGGASWADFDGNGTMDLYVANVDEEENAFYLNDGRWGFTRFFEGDHVQDRLSSNASHAADFDLDGDVDLFVTNLDGADKLYLNQGDGSFVWSGEVMGNNSNNRSASAIVGDLDGDGDLDLHVSTLIGGGSGGYNVTWMNTASEATPNNWISIAVGESGWGGSGIGARVDAYGSNDAGVFHLRRVLSTSRGSGVSGYQVAFGLGSGAALDSVRIRWPDGYSDLLDNPKVNRKYLIGRQVQRVDADPVIPVLPGDATFSMEVDAVSELSSAVVFSRPVGDTSIRQDGIAVLPVPGMLEIQIPGVETDVEYWMEVRANGITYLFGSEEEPLLLLLRRKEPRIHEVTELRSGTGPQHRIGWAASTLDIRIADLPYYSIWRLIPSGSKRPTTFYPAEAQNRDSSVLLQIGSDLWEWLGDSPAVKEAEYATTQPILLDSQGSAMPIAYRIIAHTSDPDIYHVSESVQVVPMASSVSISHVPESGDPPALIRIEAPWPNPTSGQISSRVHSAQTGELVLSVYDMLGRLVVTASRGWVSAGAYPVRLRTSDWPPGVYVLKASIGGNTATGLFTLIY